MGVKRCPACESTLISYDPWLGQMWTCKNCGYRGPLVIDEENVDK